MTIGSGERGLASRQRILVIANPTAGSASETRLRQLIDALETLGCSITLRLTKARGDAERLVTNADCGGFDAIAAAGGDGTINEILNGLPPDGPPLAVLPLGTINLLAREIGLSTSIEAIAETVVFGEVRRISIGEVNGRRFAVIASVGLDAVVVEKLDLRLKRQIGKWAYLFETVKQCLLTQPQRYRLRIGDHEREASGVIVANGRHYGGPYIAAPGADLERPSLEICRLTGRGRLAAPGYLISMALGRLSRRDDYLIGEADGIDILEPAGSPVQGDGDLLCRLPATFKVLPAAVDLIFPSTA